MSSIKISSGLYYCDVHDVRFKLEDEFVLAGYGCSECANERNYAKKMKTKKWSCSTLLYLIEIKHNNSTLWKIGITAEDVGVSKRYSGEIKSKFENIITWVYKNREDAINEEKRIIELNKDILYCGDRIFNYTGITEVFTDKPKM